MQHSCELWLLSQSLCCMMSTLSCYSESVTTWTQVRRLLLKSVVWQLLSSHNSFTQTTWTENSLSTSLLQLQKLKRDTEHNKCQRRKWQSVVQNNCACNVKKINISLKSANFYWLYDLESLTSLQLRLQRRQQRQMRTQKKSSF